MSVTDMTMTEMMGSLTGSDEDLIVARFGRDIYADGESRPMFAVRACIFIHALRSGEKPAAAKDFAQSMTVKDVNDYFADENSDESAGKDTSTPSEPPTNSPSS